MPTRIEKTHQQTHKPQEGRHDVSVHVATYSYTSSRYSHVVCMSMSLSIYNTYLALQ